MAGPGTGKTHNFKRVLEKSGGGLAITFIRALARDLERDLRDLAQVNTFHGYCRHLANNFGGVGGLTAKFDYFPGLPEVVAEDLEILGYKRAALTGLWLALCARQPGGPVASWAPPAQSTTVPVTYSASAKKRIAVAISAGSPIRPAGIARASASKVASLSSRGWPAHQGVSTTPGETALTRLGASSAARGGTI
ncbi:MAG: hypothetical protein WBV53_06025, partial [Solirubrobacterales bacterium]